METKLAQIMMESVIKMTSLTDANIFILIESGNKRFFGGKRHLCETFTKIGLLPDESDVQLEANLELSCLTPKQDEEDSPAQPSKPKRFKSSQLSNSCALTKKWSSETIAQSFLAQPISGQTLAGMSGQTSGQAASKRKEQKRKKPNKKRSPKKVKKELSDDSSDLSEIKCELIDDSFVDDKVEDKEDDDDDDDSSEDNPEKERGDWSDDAKDSEKEDASDGADAKEVLSVEDHIHDEGCEQGWCPLDNGDMGLQLMRDRLEDDPATLKKIDVVMALTESDRHKLIAFDSVHKKNVLSLFYGLGTHFAVDYYPSNDSFSSRPHQALFLRVWAMFPNLHPLGGMLVDRNSGKERSTLMCRCRDSFLGPFRKRHYRLLRNIGVVNKSK